MPQQGAPKSLTAHFQDRDGSQLRYLSLIQSHAW